MWDNVIKNPSFCTIYIYTRFPTVWVICILLASMVHICMDGMLCCREPLGNFALAFSDDQTWVPALLHCEQVTSGIALFSNFCTVPIGLCMWST